MLLIAAGCGKVTDSPAVAPHIVVLIADDLGLDHAPCLAAETNMPFLQQQCAQALVFERAYTHPLCSPSRAAMMTGRHGFRTNVLEVDQGRQKLALEEVTFVEHIKDNSPHPYRFAAFGKWHLADDENGGDLNPNLQGFDHFSGTSRQHHTYRYFDYDWYVNGKRTERPGQYRTSHIVDEVSRDFAQHHGQSPQLYWVGFTSPHLPFHLPPAELHSRPDLPARTFKPTFDYPAPPGAHTYHVRNSEIDPYFQAMLEALDTEIERLVTGLRALADRPIVFIFLGDNGTSGEVYSHSIAGNNSRFGFYRAKGSLYEGGVRVPLMIWGEGAAKDGLRPGRRPELVHLTDLFPTLASLAGVPADRPGPPGVTTDGVRIRVYEDDPDPPVQRDYVYFSRGGIASAFGAADKGGYKLILREPGDRVPVYIHENPVVELYDTTADPREMHNLFETPAHIDARRVHSLFDFIAEKFRSEPNHIRPFNETYYREVLAAKLE